MKSFHGTGAEPFDSTYSVNCLENSVQSNIHHVFEVSSMEKKLAQVVYVSSAAEEFSESDLLEQLSVFRRSNHAQGITGMMLYRDGNIMQAIEGGESAVDCLFTKIQQDPRHHQIVSLINAPISKREFSDWEMSFRKLTANEVPGFSEYLQQPLNEQESRIAAGKAKMLLDTFRQSM